MTYYQKNKDKILEYQKQYNELNKDKVKEYNNEYYQRTYIKTQRQEHYKKYYLLHREEILENQKKNNSYYVRIVCEHCKQELYKRDKKRHFCFDTEYMIKNAVNIFD